jgi:peptidoglycan hydrolase CwlO-like protein
MNNDYADRVEALKSTLDKALGILETKEDQLSKLKTKYDNLVHECKTTYDCELKDLKTKITTQQTEVETKLSEVETKLQELRDIQ